jgi:hypothetical protein
LKAALRAANAQHHASKRISEEGQGDLLESRTGRMSLPIKAFNGRFATCSTGFATCSAC